MALTSINDAPRPATEPIRVISALSCSDSKPPQAVQILDEPGRTQGPPLGWSVYHQDCEYTNDAYLFLESKCSLGTLTATVDHIHSPHPVFSDPTLFLLWGRGDAPLLDIDGEAISLARLLRVHAEHEVGRVLMLAQEYQQWAHCYGPQWLATITHTPCPGSGERDPHQHLYEVA